MDQQKKTGMMNSEDQLKELAKQLSHPKGEAGIRTADQMFINNIGMIRNTIEALKLVVNDVVLELGHGNGHHIPEILSSDAVYTGLEISQLMHAEAAKFNSSENAAFKLYDGLIIPFADDMFSKIMTVNTLYFWENPSHLINEIYRVLKPGGKFACAFAEKDFMEKLPFTKFIFQHYTRDEVTRLFKTAPFKKINFEEFTEQVWDREGNPVGRIYTVAVLQK